MQTPADFLPFARPWLLLALVLPLALIIWTWRRQTGRIALPFDHGVVRKRRLLTFLLNLAETMPAMILALAILILAGPQRLGKPRQKRALTNIEFCVDVSGSMTASFGEGNRYDASMKAINDFLDFREGDAFGLTFFGNEVLRWVPLTTDVSAFRCAPPFMNPTNPGHPPWMGGTSIGKALLFCRKSLMQQDEGDRMIILVSDGYSSDLASGVDEISRSLAEANIVVFAIHIGGGTIPEAIVKVTSETGGEVYDPSSQEGMVSVFQRIDQMKQAKLEKSIAETLDHFFPWCVAGLGLVAISTVSLYGVRYTPW
ncbi:MAG: vWA domain-containing protein [Pirellulaceae bacterium]